MWKYVHTVCPSSSSFSTVRVQGLNNMIGLLFIILEVYYSFFYFLLEFSLFISLKACHAVVVDWEGCADRGLLYCTLSL